ncbi:MAG TPA: M23 family metallopeptidase [Actinomycetota bacterium]|nr:M23 family metallopeptidase [Actinomycetota bacterium]
MRRAVRLAVCFALSLSLLTVTAAPASAQLDGLLNLLFPTPAAPPPPAEQAPPPPPAAPAPGPAPVQAPAAAAKPADPRTQPFPISVPQIRRSPARNTNLLFERLQPVVGRGISIEQALLAVASPFPVAGKANFSHDWGFPRYTPSPHLHEGTDVFAAFGTPIVTSEAGRVIQKGTLGAGGISVWVRGDSGMAYYYAHLQSWASGLAVGQRVEKGQVIGFVGDTGNAEGGSPHLHFEMHPGGGPGSPARDPKPFLDDALRRAEEQAAAFVSGNFGGVPNTAGRPFWPGFAITKEVDKLLQGTAISSPEDVMWFSMLDPTLGVLGLARQSAATGQTTQVQLTEEQKVEEQRRADVRRAVDARTEKISHFLSGSVSGSAVVVGPVKQALIH